MQGRTRLKAGRLAAVVLLGVSLPAAAGNVLRLATTTSVVHSGLLQQLVPAFEQRHNVKVEVLPVGTGRALQLARQGQIDAVVVNFRPAESAFVAEGFGVGRRDVMYTDFLLVGPAADPARVRGAGSIVEALGRIAAARAPFVSRADDSGTYRMERSYWQQANLEPRGDWYKAGGLGMGETLLLAAELRGYALTDRATYFAYKAQTGQEILLAGDNRMLNPYGVLAVSPHRSPGANHAGATAFINWLTSSGGQRAISDFRAGGEQVFFPAAMIAPLADQAR